MAVQKVQLHAGTQERAVREADAFVRNRRIFAVVDQRDRNLRENALLARRPDRLRQVHEAALEQHGVGPIGHDADGQGRGKHT
jgi:hypothetical protein